MSNEEFELKVLAARKNVDAMDKVDRHIVRELYTILLALEAGLKRPESNAGFDAYVMLRDICEDQ